MWNNFTIILRLRETLAPIPGSAGDQSLLRHMAQKVHFSLHRLCRDLKAYGGFTDNTSGRISRHFHLLMIVV